MAGGMLAGRQGQELGGTGEGGCFNTNILL